MDTHFFTADNGGQRKHAMWNVAGVHPSDTLELFKTLDFRVHKLPVIAGGAIVAFPAAGRQITEGEAVTVSDGFQGEASRAEGGFPELAEFWTMNTP